jgi:DNA-binding transcriptional LysR family regulator
MSSFFAGLKGKSFIDWHSMGKFQIVCPIYLLSKTNIKKVLFIIMMDLKTIRSFVTVAEELHFGRAAARLHIAQPPLTRQIIELEKDLSVKLFHRTKRRVQLTDAGELLLPEARKLLAQSDRIRQLAGRVEKGEIGHIDIGFVNTAVYEVLPSLLRSLRCQFPDLSIALKEMNSGEQEKALLERKITLGILRHKPSSPAIEVVEIKTDELVAVLPSDHKLAKERSIALSCLANEPFIVYPRNVGSSFADQIVEHCVHAGFTPRIEQETQEIQTAISLAAAGMGVTLAPISVQRLAWPGVAYIRLKAPTPTSTLYAAMRAPAPPWIVHISTAAFT